jgi:hypothetical protein
MMHWKAVFAGIALCCVTWAAQAETDTVPMKPALTATLLATCETDKPTCFKMVGQVMTLDRIAEHYAAETRPNYRTPYCIPEQMDEQAREGAVLDWLAARREQLKGIPVQNSVRAAELAIWPCAENSRTATPPVRRPNTEQSVPLFRGKCPTAEKHEELKALRKGMVPRDRIELPTRGFSIRCSTN